MMLLCVKGKGYEAVLSENTPFLSLESFFIPQMLLNVLMKAILHKRCQTSGSVLSVSKRLCLVSLSSGKI